MSNSRLVFSTANNQCKHCGRPLAKCRCADTPRPRKADGVVRIQRETKGRKGKGVTLITGLPLRDDELKVLAKRLKALCGSGGTVRDGVIEIQGDHRDTLKRELDPLYPVVKIAGG